MGISFSCTVSTSGWPDGIMPMRCCSGVKELQEVAKSERASVNLGEEYAHDVMSRGFINGQSRVTLLSYAQQELG